MPKVFKIPKSNKMKLDRINSKMKPPFNWTANYRQGKTDKYQNLPSHQGSKVVIPDNDAGFMVVDMDVNKSVDCPFYEDIHVRLLGLLKDACNNIVKTPNGYHLYFKANDAFKEKMLSSVNIDIFCDGNGYVMASGTVINDVEYVKEKWERLTKIPDDLICELLEHLSVDKKKPKIKSPKPIIEEEQKTFDNEPEGIAKDLKKMVFGVKNWSCCDNRSDWIKMASCLKKIAHLAGTDACTECFKHISINADNYKDVGDVLSTYDSIKCSTDDIIAKGEYNKLKQKCIQLDGKWTKMSEFLNGPRGEMEMAELILEEIAKDLIIMSNPEDDKKSLSYMYNSKNALWELVNIQLLHYHIGTVISDIFKQEMPTLKIGIEDENPDKTDEKKFQFKIIKNIHKSYGATNKLTQMITLLRGMLTRYWLDKGIFPSTFDSNGDVAPCTDAINICLKTGNNIVRVRSDYITHTFNMTSKERLVENTHKFKEIVEQFCCNDAISVRFFQKILGFFICGDNDAQKFTVFQGGGRNGKGVIIGIIKKLMNAYAMTLQNDAMVARASGNKGGATTSIMACRNRRLVFQDEIQSGEELDSQFIKTTTGGGNVSARALYGNNVEFEMRCSACLLTNEDLKIANMDNALKDRFIKVNTNAYFCDNPNPENPNEFLKDPTVPTMLWNEHKSSIINFIIEGAVMYKKEGLKDTPEKWKEELNDYFQDNNLLSSFLKKCYTVGPTRTDTLLVDMVSAYRVFLTLEGVDKFEIAKECRLNDFTKKLKKIYPHVKSGRLLGDGDISEKTGKAKKLRSKPYCLNLTLNADWSSYYDNGDESDESD